MAKPRTLKSNFGDRLALSQKVRGRSPSKNVVDGRNTTGKHYARTAAQSEEAFNPKEKRIRQKNSNKAINEGINNSLSGIRDSFANRAKGRYDIMMQPAPNSRDRLGGFKKQKNPVVRRVKARKSR